MKKFFFTLFLFINFNSLAVIHFYSDYTFSNVGISSDIVIHAPATVTFTGDITMGSNLSITVENGAFIKCIDGIIHKLTGTTNWKGIIVEPVPLGTASSGYGVYASNFEFRDAEDAIESGYYLSSTGSPTSFHNRKMYFNNVTFNENNRHFLLGNEISESDLTTVSLSKTTIYCNNTSFEKSYGVWPIHLVRTAGLRFYNCNFNDQTSVYDIALHLHSFNRGIINNCSFSGNNNGHISLHGPTLNSSINNNTFSLNSTNGTGNKVGVEIAEYMSGNTTNLTISNNSFLSSTFNPNAWGIGGDYHTGTFQKGMIIRNNQFKNLNHGVLGYALQSSSLIEKNTFESCAQGITFKGLNNSITVQCNTFISNHVDIHIYLGATLMNHNFSSDPNNTFSAGANSLNPNILNSGSQTFYYSYYTSPPATTGFPNIVLNQVGSIQSCGSNPPVEKSLAESNNEPANTSFRQYPNPTNGLVYFRANDEILSIKIMNANGQLLTELEKPESIGEFSLSNFEPGVYYCTYQFLNSLSRTERIILK